MRTVGAVEAYDDVAGGEVDVKRARRECEDTANRLYKRETATIVT
jgi:hypothetical protein